MSMLGHGAAPGTGRADPDRGPMTAATRAVASRQEVVHADTVGSTVITAEIPAVPVHRSYGVLLPDGSVWYPDSKRRLAAPWPVRMMVWILSLVLLLMLAGLAVVEWHPSWLSALRHTVGSAPTVGVGGGGGATNTTAATTPGGTTAVSSWSCSSETTASSYNGAITCTVPVSAYTITFDTGAGPCSVVVKSLVTSQSLYEGTQPAGQSHSVVVSGNATLVAFAGGASVKVLSGSTTVGTISPVLYNVLYTFKAAGSGGTG